VLDRRFDEMACTVVQTPQKRWQIQALGRTPWDCLTPRHIWADDRVVTAPPFTSTSILR
jgi:hypothetical protein